MRVLICGSRTWSDVMAIAERIRQLPADAFVISGGARGADTCADYFARYRGLGTRVYPANWDVYGVRAGIVRNRQMLDSNPDLVIAFWDGESRGTKHTIDEAKARGIPLEVIRG